MYISKSQTVTLTSLQYPFHYLAGVHCRYSINSSDDSFLRITVDTLDIDGGPNCVDSNVQISQLGKFCSDSPPDSVTVISSSSTTIDFVSGETVHGKGFNMTVKAVGMYNKIGHLCYTVHMMVNLRIHVLAGREHLK